MKKKILVHCGNAPKMERVIDIAVALAQRDFVAITPLVREDFTWQTVGETTITTYNDISDVLADMQKVAEISIKNALSHGNGAMCEGTVQLDDGSTFHFCHVVQFVSTAKDALIKNLHTYMVATESSNA